MNIEGSKENHEPEYPLATSTSRLSTSPIQSNLPSLLINLRANDGKDVSDSGSLKSTASNIFKKLIHGSRSQDDLHKPSEYSLKKTHSAGPRAGSPELAKPFIEYDNDIQTIRFPGILLNEGLSLLKVSHKSKKRILFKVDPSNFSISWKNSTSTLSTTSHNIQRILSTSPSSKSFSSVASSSSKKKTIEIFSDDVKSYFFSENASPYREELHISKDFEATWCTIIYFNHKKGKLKTLNLIADTESDFTVLSAGLKNLKIYGYEIANQFLNTNKSSVPKPLNILEDNEFKKTLSFEDILKYTSKLNVNYDRQYLRRIFDEVCGVNRDSNDIYAEGTQKPSLSLDLEKFKMFSSRLKSRDDIKSVWDTVFGCDQITFSSFKTFMKNIQKETYDDEQLYKLFKKFSFNGGELWVFESLDDFLLSKYSPCLKAIDEDLNQPLNEYYVSSSHNTYLVGRQVAGDSSINGYIRALQRGCKCIEVDVWDGKNDDDTEGNVSAPTSDSDEPVVNHGRTFTTSISFTNVIKTIKKFAFVTSPLPLIISLEVHCSIPNQLKMVKILKEILGDILVVSPLTKDPYILPSPNELQNRILVKVKKTSASLSSGEISSATSSTNTSFSEDNGTGRRSSFSLRNKTERTRICNELSDLGVYLQGIKFRNFSLPESKTFNHCFSLSEKSLNSMLKDESKRIAVEKHNRKYLMRIYPSKMRIKSSNFIPIQYWTHGAQLVATNWQTYDLGQQINEALFDSVTNKGYVLKPKVLRKPTIKGSKTVKASSTIVKTRFSIDIISAYQLPRPKNNDTQMNPYVIFELLGASTIEWDEPSMSKGKSQTVIENGFNPIWNETFSGTVTAPNDLVFVKFTIKSASYLSDESSTIGMSVVKLSNLNQGYRYVTINDQLGDQLIYSSLFIKVSHHQDFMI